MKSLVLKSLWCATLAFAGLAMTACGPDGLLGGQAATGAGVRNLAPLDPTFQYAAAGHGFDADRRLLLIGNEETIRWNPDKKAFERFGGKLPGIVGDRIQRDDTGTLYLMDGATAYSLVKGATQWTPVSLELPPFAADSGRLYRNGAKGLRVDRRGVQYVAAEYMGDAGGPSGYVVYRRAEATAPFTKLVEFEKNAAPYKFITDLRNDMQVRADGTLFLKTGGGYFTVAPGATELKPLLDCENTLGGICSGLELFTHPESDVAYLANSAFGPMVAYRIPAIGTFPITPEKLTPYPGAIERARDSQFQVDAKGGLWGFLTVPKALSVNYPPYELDVTTLRKLEGTTWEPRVSFATPSYTFVLGDDETIYSYGRQLASGGSWLGVAIYALRP